MDPRLFDVLANVLEKLMFARQFGVTLQMVGYLHEIMTQALEIYVLGRRSPPKMKVALLQVGGLKPDLRPTRQGCAPDIMILPIFFSQQDPAHQIRVVAGKDLAFEGLTLSYGQTPDICIHKIRRRLIQKVATVLFQRILAVSQMCHDGVLIIHALGNSVGLREVLLVRFVALFVAGCRVSLLGQIVVGVTAAGLDYKVIGLLEKILRLLNYKVLLLFIGRGSRIERFRLLVHLARVRREGTIFRALPDLALDFMSNRVPGILPLVFQE